MCRKVARLALITMAWILCAHLQAHASDLVVDSHFVSGKIGDPSWVILDVRTGEEYKEGHIPGAITLGKMAAKVLRDPTHRAYTMVPSIERTLGEAGIGDDKHIIVYGNALDTFYNTVTFWILEYLGCNSAQLKCTAHYLDGGIEQWEAGGGKVETVDTVLPHASFEARIVPSRLAETAEVLKIVLGKERTVLIDARTEAEYNGSDIRALRGGHIPGAVNIKVQKNYDDKAFKTLPLSELKSLYKDIPLKERVIAYCQTGTRATYTYLVLRELGYENVANYDDSWMVYGSNVNYPADEEQWFNFIEVNQTAKDLKALQKELHELQGK
ncbi:MAG: sulfurtransferase [Dissulfurispiraceae bacterium]